MFDRSHPTMAAHPNDENTDPLDFERAAELLRVYLAETRRGIAAAAIFGSVAKGCNSRSSDIDVLIVSSAPVLTKQNVGFRGERIQLIDGSAQAIRQRFANVIQSRNDFIISVVLDSRWVAGDVHVITALKTAAEPIAKAGMPPMHRNHYLSIRSRCADAIEKIRSATDVHQRMFVGQRIYSLLHEIAAANSRVSLHIGTGCYPQFTEIAPNFAIAMASRLRNAIVQDDYDEFIDAVRSFFERTGGFTWECNVALPI